MNGKLVADTNEVVGAYRTYQFNITELIAAGKPNVLAVETFPADKNELGINAGGLEPDAAGQKAWGCGETYADDHRAGGNALPTRVLTKLDLARHEPRASADFRRPGKPKRHGHEGDVEGHD